MDSRYDHLAHEKEAREQWEKEQTYRSNRKAETVFSIDTPPPTVSGSTLHIGHVFSYTHPDLIARYMRMYLPNATIQYGMGTDDNGLATERYVEKKRNIKAVAVGRAAFIKICHEEVEKAAEVFKKVWQTLGLSIDWEQRYSTISPAVTALSQASFLELLSKNQVYRTYQPAPYCVVCQTSVAQAELDDHEKTSTFHTILFKDHNDNSLPVATTRPELLPSCVALFYNPTDLRYHHLAGTTATVPLFNYTVPLIADEGVIINKGTGLVMCCTFGDKSDVIWQKQYQLPYKKTIEDNGLLCASIPVIGGMSIAQAREEIVNQLQQHNLLQQSTPIAHTTNVHERCKTPIEYLMRSQWFLKIVEQKARFLAAGDEIDWKPAHMKSRYRDWVTHLNMDWCLSRQRFFGIPFPVWHCINCCAILPATKEQLPLCPQTTPYTKLCAICGSNDIVPDTDVMDTWNTSSLTPYICAMMYHNEGIDALQNSHNFIPMSLRPQAHDIIRTWAFDTIVKSILHNNTIPWKTIAISGHVLSNAHEKISKSKGNSIAEPETLFHTYSADAVRYWAASATLGTDTPFSQQQIKMGSRLLTKLWNAFRFIATHTANHELPLLPHIVPSDSINQWIFHEMHATWLQYEQQFNNYEFSRALHTAESFFWKHFCDNYLEYIKEPLSNPSLFEAEIVHNTRLTLFHIGLSILQLFAPFLPHLTETLYRSLYRARAQISSIHLTQFALFQAKAHFPESVVQVNALSSIINAVRKLKSDHKLSLKTALDRLYIISSPREPQQLDAYEKQICMSVTKAQQLIMQSRLSEEKKESDLLIQRDEQKYDATIYL